MANREKKIKIVLSKIVSIFNKNCVMAYFLKSNLKQASAKDKSKILSTIRKRSSSELSLEMKFEISKESSAISPFFPQVFFYKIFQKNPFSENFCGIFARKKMETLTKVNFRIPGYIFLENIKLTKIFLQRFF